MIKFCTCLGTGKLPPDHGLGVITGGHPGGDLGLYDRQRVEATIQALFVQNGKFNLSHVQPTPMVGRVAKLQFVQQPFRLAGRECLVERRWRMGVQGIQHHANLGRMREMDVHQHLHLVGKILFRALGGHGHLPPARQGLNHQKQIACPRPAIFIVDPRGHTRAGRDRLPSFGNQLRG